MNDILVFKYCLLIIIMHVFGAVGEQFACCTIRIKRIVYSIYHCKNNMIHCLNNFCFDANNKINSFKSS